MAEVIDLHSYYMQCQNCGGFGWAIRYTQDCEEIMQIECLTDDCECVLENPGIGSSDIIFEPEFEIDSSTD